MSTSTKTATPAKRPVDLSGLSLADAKPVDGLGNGVGRPATQVPASLVAMVEASWNDGTPKALAITLPDEDAVKAFRRLISRAGAERTVPLTIRTATDESNPLTVRFQAAPKVSRKSASA